MSPTASYDSWKSHSGIARLGSRPGRGLGIGPTCLVLRPIKKYTAQAASAAGARLK